MTDIAKRAQVSASTVSRALRNDPRIPAHTRERIIELSETMGYRTNPLVRALMASRRKRHSDLHCAIGFITTDLGPEQWHKKPTCVRYFSGIQNRAEELGYEIDVISTQELKQKPLEKVLAARGIPAVIFGFSPASMKSISFDLTGVAAIGLGNYFPYLNIDRVRANGLQNVRLGLRKLRAKGYRKIGFVTPEVNNAHVDHQWSSAALEDMRKQPKQYACPPLVCTGARCSFSAFEEWFGKNQPEAILSYKVDVASFLRKIPACAERDAGIAHIFRTEAQRKKYPGIDGCLEKVGAAAVDHLVSKLHINQTGLSEQSLQISVDGRWLDP